MVRAIVRPEKSDEVLAALMGVGFPADTKMDVYGRGKQRGIKVGDITYDELPKVMVFTVVDEKWKSLVVDTIMKAARTGSAGSYGDGKIFVQSVLDAFRVRTGEQGTGAVV